MVIGIVIKILEFYHKYSSYLCSTSIHPQSSASLSSHQTKSLYRTSFHSTLTLLFIYQTSLQLTHKQLPFFFQHSKSFLFKIHRTSQRSSFNRNIHLTIELISLPFHQSIHFFPSTKQLSTSLFLPQNILSRHHSSTNSHLHSFSFISLNHSIKHLYFIIQLAHYTYTLKLPFFFFSCSRSC